MYIYDTPLTNAVSKGNVEIIKLLLMNKNLDINKMYILEYIIFINKIHKLIFESHSQLNI